MCVIERKTYYHTDGRQETIERAKPCDRAVGKRLCKHVERRSWEAARIVETKPSSSITPPENDRDGYIVTEGSRGQQRLYRDLSKRSSNSTSSVRRSATMSERTTPISTPSSASSPSYVEVKPEAPSPPPAAAPLYGERTRTPYSSSKPKPSFTKDGTAIYERPPSMDQARAIDNERPRASRLSKESSFSSIAAEVDDSGEPTLSQRRRQPSISVDTDARPATPSSAASATVSSPGLSQLKGAFRRDSGKDVKRKSSLRQRTDSDRRRDEEERQARLERDRLAESDRRQSVRDKLARDASRERRERHRADAKDALEGKRHRDDSIQRGRDAERAAMDLERERTVQLRRDEELGQQQYHDDQRRRAAEARLRDEAAATAAATTRYPPPQPSRPRIQPRQPSTSTSPAATRAQPITSARAFTGAQNAAALQPLPPHIHQSPPEQTIHQRGEDVIARERARAAGRSLNDALGGLSLREQEERQRDAEEYQRDVQARYRLGGGGSGRRWR